MKIMKKISLLMILCLSLTMFLAACGGKSDTEIQKEVTARVKTPGVTVTSVKDGVVTLGGTVATQAERDAAVAAAKGEGVKEVKEAIQIKPPMPAPTMAPAAPAAPAASAKPAMSPAKPMANAARK
jgi:hyperosmotically inducible protein